MTKTQALKPRFPLHAGTSINRCNLPVEVLGDLSFQNNPKPLCIDGVAQLHQRFFALLDTEADAEGRSLWFTQYMKAHFRLDALDEAGFDLAMSVDRSRVNYLRVLRGWFFDSDSMEGAIIKAWVESRFGLHPRYHKGSIRSIEDKTYADFVTQSTRGLYNTNALEAQLDLLYSYCQYELTRRFQGRNSLILYRGQNHLQALEQMEVTPENSNHETLLLNNISSFTSDPARAGEFGDVVISAEVPHAKLMFFRGLMPGIMAGESEYAVIGGIYQVSVVKDISRL